MGFESFRKNSRMNFNETVLRAKDKKNAYSDGYEYWKIEPDKEKGTGSAVIRFLPPKDTELPYVKIYTHFFKGDDDKWYIDRCPTTYGEQCPICSANSLLYKSGEEDKAKKRKRNSNYIFNIYVVRDPANPDNEGKVFLYKTGPSIFNMITESMTPQFDGEEPKKPFDIYGGHNFNLRVRSDTNRNGLPTYDKSFFDENPTDLANSDEELEKIYNAMTNLDEYMNTGKPDINEIEKKIASAYCNSASVRASIDSKIHNHVESSVQSRTNSEPSESYKAMDKLPWDEDEDVSLNASLSSEEEDTLEYFKKLASE